MTAIAVTIAGSDSGGGAGIQADLKTFSALGVYGASVVTALTAQNTLGVQGVFAVPPAFIGQQIDSVFSDLAVRAVKVGMLPDAGAIEAVEDGLRRYAVDAVVLDPVMVATSGDALIDADAVEHLSRRLLPLATLVTPNMPEAARLLGCEAARDRSEMEEQARRILDLGAHAVLLKGGHAGGDDSADVLVSPEGSVWLAASRHATRHTHGTGCTLSSAIAAGLAKGFALSHSLTEAKDYVTRAIVAADALAVGNGNGPVHHFHALWPADVATPLEPTRHD